MLLLSLVACLRVRRAEWKSSARHTSELTTPLVGPAVQSHKDMDSPPRQLTTVYVNVSDAFFEIEAAPVRDVLDMSRCSG